MMQIFLLVILLPKINGKHEFNIEKVHWGEIIEDDIEEEMPEDNDYADNTDIRTETEIKSGISSMISGMETPDTDIRKRMPTDGVQNINMNDNSRPLYTVLEPMKVILSIKFSTLLSI